MNVRTLQMWLKRSLVAGTTAGLLLSAPQVQATQQTSSPWQVKVTDAKVFDLALKEAGTLRGRVVDANGTPQVDKEVLIKQAGQVVQRTQTNAQGVFEVHGLRSGLYEVSSGQTVGTYRLWQPEVAPPSAMEQALLVIGENGTRGQFGAMGGGLLLLGGVAVASLVISIISLSRIEDVNDKLDASP